MTPSQLNTPIVNWTRCAIGQRIWAQLTLDPRTLTVPITMATPKYIPNQRWLKALFWVGQCVHIRGKMPISSLSRRKQCLWHYFAQFAVPLNSDRKRNQMETEGDKSENMTLPRLAGLYNPHRYGAYIYIFIYMYIWKTYVTAELESRSGTWAVADHLTFRLTQRTFPTFIPMYFCIFNDFNYWGIICIHSA